MSKLRIIGGALIVLFLVTIIAMGIMAINLANLSTQQSNLSSDVAAIKKVLSNTTTVSTSDSTSASLETTNPDADADAVTSTAVDMQTCSNETIGVKLSAPASWTCSNAGDFEGQSYLTLTKGDISLSIGTPGIGFLCNENCVSFNSYTSDRANLNVSWKDGKIANILGTIVAGKGMSATVQPVQQVSVRNTKGEIGSEFPLKSEIFSILDSISTL